MNDNPLYNILFNILLPVIILNQATAHLGAPQALVLALSIPIAYGLWDLVQKKKTNWMSVLGIFNVLLTGGLALMHLEGIWFAVKEAAFPLILGAAVCASAFSKKPFLKTVVFQPHALNVDNILNALPADQGIHKLESHFRTSTLLFSGSFLISSALNFALAYRIFSDIPAEILEPQRSVILNDQIAKMTSLSFVVIVLPLMLVSALVMWYLLNGIKKLTALEWPQILPQDKKSI